MLKGQGAVNAVAFTLTPFSLWYRDIAAAACSLICAVAEPLVVTPFPLVVLEDAPATPLLIAGAP